MNEEERLLNGILEQSGMREPLPSSARAAAIANRRRTLVRILTEQGRYTARLGAILRVQSLLHRVGLNASLTQSTVVCYVLAALLALLVVVLICLVVFVGYGVFWL